jgi:hypothetical protein
MRQSFSSQLQILKREAKLTAKRKLLGSEKVVLMAYFVGVALIIGGQFVYRYASQRVSELEAKLSPALSVYDYGMVKGSLDWWRSALISIYGPISIYLITTGIALLVFLTAYVVLSILRSKQTAYALHQTIQETQVTILTNGTLGVDLAFHSFFQLHAHRMRTTVAEDEVILTSFSRQLSAFFSFDKSSFLFRGRKNVHH